MQPWQCYLFKMIGGDDAMPLKSGHMTDIYRTALYGVRLHCIYTLYNIYIYGERCLDKVYIEVFSDWVT